MKKRIIAVVLSFSVFICSFCIGNRRAYATGAEVGVIITIGVLAWELIGVCTGMLDGAASAIGTFIESGVDGLTNPDSNFQQGFKGFADNWLDGWDAICDSIQGMFNKGELEIVDDRVKLSYQQYMQLCKELISAAPKPGVDFESNQPAFFLDLQGMPYKFPAGSLPTYSVFFHDFPGQSYALCYYNDEQIVFSDYYFLFYISEYIGSNGGYGFNWSLNSLTKTFYENNIFGFSSAFFPDRYDENLLSPYLNPDFNFTCNDLSSSAISYYFSGGVLTNGYNTSNCFVFTNGKLTYTPISEVDLTGCQLGMVTTSHDYAGFLKSLTGYAAVEGVPPLDDLSGVLPTEYNPSLSFPVNPDLSRPLDNQIIVGDVPGVSDLPLSDYQAKLKTDIEVPSIIVSKFPFCIPFDFMRFLGLLCSDPVAPVFRIPISTNPGNLQQWQGNQTVGEYLTPSEPMFEIDEEIVIDLSVIPLVQPICYTCFIVGFIIMLLHITPKMIQH